MHQDILYMVFTLPIQTRYFQILKNFITIVRSELIHVYLLINTNKQLQQQRYNLKLMAYIFIFIKLKSTKFRISKHQRAKNGENSLKIYGLCPPRVLLLIIPIEAFPTKHSLMQIFLATSPNDIYALALVWFETKLNEIWEKLLGG